jgi:hypothetical protein
VIALKQILVDTILEGTQRSFKRQSPFFGELIKCVAFLALFLILATVMGTPDSICNSWIRGEQQIKGVRVVVDSLAVGLAYESNSKDVIS